MTDPMIDPVYIRVPADRAQNIPWDWEDVTKEVTDLRAKLEQMCDAFEGMSLARDDEQRQRVEVEAELDGYRNGNRDLHEENQALRAELERMRPVAEAAIANAHPSRRDGNGALLFGSDLMEAVDAYRASNEERSHCEHGTWLAEDVCLACPADPNDPDDPRNGHTDSSQSHHREGAYHGKQRPSYHEMAEAILAWANHLTGKGEGPSRGQVLELADKLRAIDKEQA